LAKGTHVRSDSNLLVDFILYSTFKNSEKPVPGIRYLPQMKR